MCLFTLLHTSITGTSQHLSGIAVSIHLSVTIGATFMSFTMIGNISTKLLIGFLSISCLTSLHTVTRRFILQKARHHPLTGSDFL